MGLLLLLLPVIDSTVFPLTLRLICTAKDLNNDEGKQKTSVQLPEKADFGRFCHYLIW